MNTVDLIGQRLLSILERPAGLLRKWPEFYVGTDQGCYRHDGGCCFTPVDKPRQTSLASESSPAFGLLIEDIRSDGETTVLKMSDGSVVCFELAGHATVEGIVSWPGMSFETKLQSDSWLPGFLQDNPPMRFLDAQPAPAGKW
ncbi:MAG: hypothetical protein ACO1TE_00510 [Prosthecobacter sp.]